MILITLPFLARYNSLAPLWTRQKHVSFVSTIDFRPSVNFLFGFRSYIALAKSYRCCSGTEADRRVPLWPQLAAYYRCLWRSSAWTGAILSNKDRWAREWRYGARVVAWGLIGCQRRVRASDWWTGSRRWEPTRMTSLAKQTNETMTLDC